MSKNIPSALQTAIGEGVTTLAICVEIVRQDLKTFRFTNHDSTLTVGSKTFTHEVPFYTTDFTSSSGFTVDNTEISLICDGINFDKADFEAGLFNQASVEITLVNWSDPTDGTMTVRKGWIGKTTQNSQETVSFSVYGLLSILNYKVGRVYQAGCSAQFGDAKCKIPVAFDKIYSPLNTYRVGDWVHRLNTAELTPVTLTNGGFDADGSRTTAQAITGWTKTPGSQWVVAATSGALSAHSGGFAVYGETVADTRYTQGLYRDLTLADIGTNAADVDDGLITFGYSVKIAQFQDVTDRPRLITECFDANDILIDKVESEYYLPETVGVWEERYQVTPLIAGTRKVRVTLEALKTAGTRVKVAFDGFSAFFYDHFADNPTDGVIYRVARIRNSAAADDYRGLDNPSFEANAAPMANSNSATINGWTRGSSADWWRLTGTVGTQTPQFGSYLLVGGDDSSGTQKTYNLYQTKTLVSALGLDQTRLSLSKYVLSMIGYIAWGDAASAAAVNLYWYDDTNTLISSAVLFAEATRPAETSEYFTAFASVPATAEYFVVELKAKSPVSSSAANVGFDSIYTYIYDAERAGGTDLIQAKGAASTIWNPTATEYTVDSDLIWKALPDLVKYDVVATAADRKNFTGTNIAGADADYSTAFIRWISGPNAGKRNMVRVYNSGTKGIRLYFPSPVTITAGDVFQYVRACDKSFISACKTTFDNGLNFRGFPYIQGTTG